MSDDDATDTGSNRRTVLQLAALAGLPVAMSGTASASSDHDHMGETWGSTSVGQSGLNIETLSGIPLDVHSEKNSALSATTDTGAAGVQAISQADNETAYGLYAYADSSNSDSYAVYSNGDLKVNGDLQASGTKNFVQTVDTDDGPKEVAYTAVEGDRARTETAGVAELDDGRAVIDLPEHFGLVTSDREDLVVQLTPYAVDVPGLAVTERSTDRVVVESIEGSGDFEFSYTVRGVRDGYADREVVTDGEETRPEGLAGSNS
ncbi:hypothetical protein [Halorussus halobius]|uniref:hypothetical protein n=1 Tax=Halorussus halobius TaxID=1710537 RepID=UPI001091ACC8|nr:hypothetical protein [Halorussus halobius]